MPPLRSRKLGLAFDMHGCPNACRHCYVGDLPGGAMSEQDVRWAAELFRGFARKDDAAAFFEEMKVCTSAREPDFSDDYRRLYQLEAELSDGKPCRYELLSIWRVARDEGYARWAKTVGPDTCQISFFGTDETNDWFFRRKGAFRDGLAATERLLEAGMKPRWQLFLTRKILAELPDLLKLVEKMRLRQRVESLGGEFDIFMHTPGPHGRARRIEHLRPTIDELKHIPGEIIESSKKHFKAETLHCTEAELCSQIVAAEDAFPYAYPQPEMLWLLATTTFDVFPINMGTSEPWWRLGNLKTDLVEAILRRFEHNETPGLRTICGISPKELVRKHGDLRSRRVYDARDDLLALYVDRHCQR